MVGFSTRSWGAPVRAFSDGGLDGFVATLGPDGALVWNTFLGSAAADILDGVVMAPGAGVFVSGHSRASWGDPLWPYVGGPSDALVAELDGAGRLAWHAFFGGPGGGHAFDDDYGNAITTDGFGQVFVVGDSNGAWGSPTRPFFGGDNDAFAAAFRAPDVRRCSEDDGDAGSGDAGVDGD